jgi:ABC-type multidrug transport system fused ATPase/permease subunit
VSFTYDSGLNKEDQKPILKDLSFTVPAGKSVALVGATGSGKSTIMRLLYRFYECNEGKILIDGQDITRMRINDLRSNIAIVP